MLKIVFVTTVDRNPGDSFIRAGIEYLIRQFIPYYQPVYIDKHEYKSLQGKGWFGRLTKGRLDLFDQADLVIQAGTPFYYISPGKDGTYARHTSSISTDWIQEVWLNRLLKRGFDTPILNLAVGTCQPYHSDGMEFSQDEQMVEFVRDTVLASRLTIVREKLAAHLLSSHGLEASCLPCSAIFAADHHRVYPERPTFVCLNYMPGGAHYTLGQAIDFEGWEKTFLSVYRDLSQCYRVVVMCHSPSEVIKARALLPEADTFFSADYRDYLHMYARARIGVLNRVHGAVVMAGLGRPAVVVGNDSRARMAELIGLPTYYVNGVTREEIDGQIADFDAHPDAWSERLMAVKDNARRQYLGHLGVVLSRVLSEIENKPGYQRSDFDKVKPR